MFVHTSDTCSEQLTGVRCPAIQIRSGLFTGNVAAKAGAGVYGSRVQIGCDDCTFAGNRVPGDSQGGCGGGLKLVSHAAADVVGSAFRNNSAPDGGAVCVDGSLFNGSRVDLSENRAENGGGAMEIVGPQPVALPGSLLMACSGCNVVGNAATDGGKWMAAAASRFQDGTKFLH